MRMDRRSDSGFTLVELFAVIALMACGTAMLVMVTQGVSKLGKADSGSKQVAAVLRGAREEAISKRRNIKVSFDLTGTGTGMAMVVSRQEYTWTAGAVTGTNDVVEKRVALESGVQFLKFAGITAYPITGFPTSASAVTFTQVSSVPTVVFTPEGYAQDPVTGVPTDGTMFLGRTNEFESARAVTLTGVTGLLERWQYNRTAWVTAK